MNTTLGTIPLGAAAVVAAAALVACGGEGDGEAGREAAAVEFPVDSATAGAISGTVRFEGTPPEMRTINMSEEPTCAEKHEEPPRSQEVVVNDDGTLRWVFVHVKSGLDDLEFPTPQEPAVLDQQGCIYEPHVLALQAGQTLEIENSDGILHNINARPSANRGFNISQPTDMTSTRTFAVPEVMIPVKCDVHGWMSAFIGVKEHPYHGVTDEEGSFRLDVLPPGTYEVEAWHERYGTLTETVTVAEGETAEVTFTFSEEMAENAVVPLGEPFDPHDHSASAHTAGGRQ